MSNMLDAVNAGKAVADHAALQTPTWWVGMLVLVVVVASVFLIKWFIKTFEAVTKRHEELMTQIIMDQQKTISELATIITKNTEALDGCRLALEQQRASQAECQRLQDGLRRMIPA